METVLFQETTFNTGRVVLNYAECPAAGPALVMLHGGTGRWQLYFDMLAELARHGHVYAPDLRGHGKSGRVPRGYTIRDYVEDIAAFMQEVSGPAVLMGHSLGGIVAVVTAQACPDLVRALIVGDAPLDAGTWGQAMREQRGKNAAWRALAGGALTDEEVQRALALLANVTHRRFSGTDHMLLYDPQGPPMEAVKAFLAQLSL
jgi:pimeloyl-ACP methyl ester carboxylesterase